MKHIGNTCLCVICMITLIFTISYMPFITEESSTLESTNQIKCEVGDHLKKLTPIVSSDRSYPWINDTQCARFPVDYGINLPRVYLYSYPRSGNHWSRYLIEGATGIYTSEIFNKLIRGREFLAEIGFKNTGRFIVAKSHNFADLKQPIILLVRNPMRSHVSWHEFNLAGRQGKNLKERLTFVYNDTNIFNKGFHTWVTNSEIKHWENSLSAVIKNAKRLLIVQYSDLVNDPIKELKKMTDFIGVAVDPMRIECLKKHIDGKAKRLKDNVIKKDPFTTLEKKQYEKAIENVNNLLKQRGYPTIPGIDCNIC